jgi:hypothetical protein
MELNIKASLGLATHRSRLSTLTKYLLIEENVAPSALWLIANWILEVKRRTQKLRFAAYSNLTTA